MDPEKPGRSSQPDRRQLGCEAELLAERYLAARAHRILLRNYRCRMGELDLVTQDAAGTLVIAEVRLRTRSDYGGAAASVDAHKHRRLLRASRHLLARHPLLSRLPVRFDVLEVSPGQGGYTIHWIRHAFSA